MYIFVKFVSLKGALNLILVCMHSSAHIDTHAYIYIRTRTRIYIYAHISQRAHTAVALTPLHHRTPHTTPSLAPPSRVPSPDLNASFNVETLDFSQSESIEIRSLPNGITGCKSQHCFQVGYCLCNIYFSFIYIYALYIVYLSENFCFITGIF